MPHPNLTSDHFDGRRFINQSGPHRPSFADVRRMLLTKRTPWPKRIPVQQRVPQPQPPGNDIRVTFIGHSTFLIQTHDATVITDPVFSERAGPFGVSGPRRVRDPGVSLRNLPEITIVLLSHNHYDHCDLQALRSIARRYSPLFIAPLGNARLLRKAGARRVEELDWWDKSTSAPTAITLTPAQHFSARTPFDRNRSLWGGFVFALRGKNIFFAGDSGYGPHFRQIHQRFGAMHLALLPIGAYEPRWFMKPIHMNPEEAVRAHLDLNARQSIASHFGTFQLTPEGIDEPLSALADALARENLPSQRFRALEFGDSLLLAS